MKKLFFVLCLICINMQNSAFGHIDAIRQEQYNRATLINMQRNLIISQNMALVDALNAITHKSEQYVQNDVRMRKISDIARRASNEVYRTTFLENQNREAIRALRSILTICDNYGKNENFRELANISSQALKIAGMAPNRTIYLKN